jgi:hypothetical protein
MVLKGNSLHPAKAKSVVLESDFYVGILATVTFVRFVKSVDRLQVFPENRKITSLQIDHAIEPQEFSNQRRGSPADRSVPTFGFAKEAVFEEAEGRAVEEPRAYVFRGQSFADFSRKFHPSAGPIGSRGAADPVVMDEISVRNAVAVEKNEEVAAGAPNAFVQKSTLPKTPIFLPEVDEGNPDPRERSFKRPHEVPRGFSASVVAKKDLEISETLSEKSG